MAELLTSCVLRVPHGFSTRHGAEAADVLPGGVPVRVRQVHSARAVTVDGPFAGPGEVEADALVTARPGLVLAIVTADCAPVLLADEEAGVVAAAHGGWRGAVAGVLDNTVAAMVAAGARRERIAAAIGPCIAQASYEVDAALAREFAAGDARFFAPGREGHYQFDLAGYVAHRLGQAGVARIDDLARDTYADEARFFSYRRATHRGEPTGGRQTSLIALRETA